jgi:hypothetical protein
VKLPRDISVQQFVDALSTSSTSAYIRSGATSFSKRPAHQRLAIAAHHSLRIGTPNSIPGTVPLQGCVSGCDR